MTDFLTPECCGVVPVGGGRLPFQRESHKYVGEVMEGMLVVPADVECVRFTVVVHNSTRVIRLNDSSEVRLTV